MHSKKKILAFACLFSAIFISVAATLPQQQPQFTPPKLVNLKVFPKNIPYRVLDHEMDEWSASLGVRCNFCHARNEQTGKMDFPSDAKPEKEAARHMYLMMNKINRKFFDAKKDSLGMVITAGVNCYTCHRGDAHPEIKVPEEHHGPGGPPPGGAPPAGAPPAGGQH
jgi:hypothetical protein